MLCSAIFDDIFLICAVVIFSVPLICPSLSNSFTFIYVVMYMLPLTHISLTGKFQLEILYLLVFDVTR